VSASGGGAQRIAETSAQLRNDIDQGRAGDKTPGSDPAAAPLGTDAEAGGYSPTKAEIQQASANELRPAAGRQNAVWSTFRPAGEIRYFPALQLASVALCTLAAIAFIVLELQ
jgi:hypothetical protein